LPTGAADEDHAVTTLQPPRDRVDRRTRRRAVLLALADAALRDAARITGPRSDALRAHARDLELQAACLDPT
jgi:hypothetical protein